MYYCEWPFLPNAFLNKFVIGYRKATDFSMLDFIACLMGVFTNQRDFQWRLKHRMVSSENMSNLISLPNCIPLIASSFSDCFNDISKRILNKKRENDGLVSFCI